MPASEIVFQMTLALNPYISGAVPLGLSEQCETGPTPPGDRKRPQTKVQIQRWREHKKDTLIGFSNIELSGQGMAIKGLALH